MISDLYNADSVDDLDNANFAARLHMLVCKRHPMRKLERKIKRLEKENSKLKVAYESGL
jgi:hypothetical protein